MMAIRPGQNLEGHNGGLFSASQESKIGHEINNLSISNDCLIPSLKGLLTADTEYGYLSGRILDL